MIGTFTKYIGTPFEKDVRPAIPPNGVLAKTSKVEPANRGKMPGLWTSSGWVGMPKCLQNTPASPGGMKRWDGWDTENVVLRGGNFIGVDLDTDDNPLVNELRLLSENLLGPAPVRGRPDSCHCLLIYRKAEGAPMIRKQTLAWRMLGDDQQGKPQHLLEILGDSGNMMIEGVHPSGRQYEYDGCRELIAWGADLSVVNPDHIAKFKEAAISTIVAAGGVITSHSSSSSMDARRLPIGDLAHLASTIELAIQALDFIDCGSLDYDEWIRVTAAFKVATGGDPEAYDAYVNWCLDYPDNYEEVADAKWESVQDSTIGAEWLFRKAAEWGFDYIAAMFKDLDEEAVEKDPPSGRAA